MHTGIALKLQVNMLEVKYYICFAGPSVSTWPAEGAGAKVGEEEERQVSPKRTTRSQARRQETAFGGQGALSLQAGWIAAEVGRE